MPVENFNVRKTTEHTGVRTEKLVISALSVTTQASNLYVDPVNGIVYQSQYIL